MRARLLMLAVIITGLLSGMARADDAATVERGHYLAILGDCVVCHTRTEAGAQPFAGGYALHAVPGTVYSSNITPDRETGIGNWNADDFYRALHDGVAKDGRHLYPAFPYAYFARLSHADSDALFAYVRTLKPIPYRPPRNDLIFPTNIRGGMRVWNMLYLSGGGFKPDPSKSASWNRGKEIVTGIGHCGACHSPKNFLFADTDGASLNGTLVDGWYAPNLTGTKRDGLGDWTAADIVEYLKTGQNKFARVAGAMRDVVQRSTSLMTDADREAVADYLKSLPAEKIHPTRPPNPEAMQAGEAVYVARCASCHGVSGKGDADYPALAANTIVQARDPSTVLRVILQGAQAIQPKGYSMPAFPVLKDRELADLATYIRNAWGNRGEPVTPKDAKALRKLLRNT
jgi:mono/diheme cytochrome c family protein